MNKNYYRILWGCLAVVVIAGGIYYFAGRNRNTEPDTTPQNTEARRQTTAHQVIMNQTPALEEAVAQREQQITAEATEQTEQTEQTTVAQAPQQSQDNTEKQNTQKQDTQKQNTQSANVIENEPLFAMPLAGNIVMDYSADHAIYDATLDQYRTNDHISIGAKKGDPVKASEDGTVESVRTDDERGITVVINHDNGWQTTYSQLQEDVVVKEGDKVKKGQQIGAVAEPTKYSVALGEHVDFSIAKDGIKVDPKSNVAE